MTVVRFRARRVLGIPKTFSVLDGTEAEVSVANPWHQDRPLAMRCVLTDGREGLCSNGVIYSWMTDAGELLSENGVAWWLDRFTPAHRPVTPIVQEAGVRGESIRNHFSAAFGG